MSHHRSGAAQVAAAARLLARLQFVTAFGHVSARSGDGLLLTPTWPPLSRLTPNDVLGLDAAGGVLHGQVAHRPLETPLHASIYARRPDVAAICRVHSPSVSIWACRSGPPPLLHGFGGMAYPIRFWPDPDLVHSEQLGERAATVLADAPALLLRGNGGLVVGASLPEALARAWCLEDACRVALAGGDPLTGPQLERRRAWYGAEAGRLWRWLWDVYGDTDAWPEH